MKTQLDLFPSLPTVRDPKTYWRRLQNYMKSDKWKAIAEETKRRAGYVCEYMGPTCTIDQSLQAHHKTYIAIFRERPGIDVVCVCGACHQYIHSHPRMLPDNDNNPPTAAAANE